MMNDRVSGEGWVPLRSFSNEHGSILGNVRSFRREFSTVTTPWIGNGSCRRGGWGSRDRGGHRRERAGRGRK
jgi:hypothetical protein